MRKVEIKAAVYNVTKLLEKIRQIVGSEIEIVRENDTFFVISQGRLKLRKSESGGSQLIFYERPDTTGPKMCYYEYADIPKDIISSLHNVLSRALHTKIVVNKTRRIFLADQTRIHIDSVENLGDFIELEVLLNEDQSCDDGEKIAYKLMESLEISQNQLINGAYADLLQNNNLCL